MPYSTYKTEDDKVYEHRLFYPPSSHYPAGGTMFSLRRKPTKMPVPAEYHPTETVESRFGKMRKLIKQAEPGSRDGFYFGFLINGMPSCCGASFMHGFSTSDGWYSMAGDTEQVILETVTDTDLKVFKQWMREKLMHYTHPVFFIIHEEEWMEHKKSSYGENYAKMCASLRDFSEQACLWTNSMHSSRLEMRATIPTKLREGNYDVKFETPTRG